MSPELASFSIREHRTPNFMKNIPFIILLCIVTNLAIGQEKSEQNLESPDQITSILPSFEDSLKIVARKMIRDTDSKVRIQAQEDFSEYFLMALEEENSFDYPFDSLETISIIYPADKSFRLITWQLCVNSNEFQYFGLLQRNSEKADIVQLHDRSDEVMIPEKQILDKDSWYGSLYYNIHQVGSKNNRYYLLFGFDANDLYSRIKLIDVLTFDEGNPTFGLPVFKFEEENKPPKIKNRFVIEYGANSSIRLNYDDDLNLIIYDNLIPIGGQYKDEGIFMVSDGSYRGLKLNGGVWTSVDKIFHQTQDEAPRPNPILDSRKGQSGLFGPDKNN